MELAHHMKDFTTGVGVDFVLFDGEEYIFDPACPASASGDKYFLGSEHFADEYAKNRAKLKYRYEAAILLDLFAHEDAAAGGRGVLVAVRPEAGRAGLGGGRGGRGEVVQVRARVRPRDEVLDDHLALNRAGIPAIDVIDFDYPHWHKLTDTPDKCSAEQMAEVGKVLTAWLQHRSDPESRHQSRPDLS